MSSDEELEYENVRASLLPGADKEQSQKLHGDMGRFAVPHSDGESSYYNETFEITSEEKEALISAVQSDINENTTTCPRIKATGFKHWIPKRFIVLALLLFGNFNMYCIRMCLSVTIVAMSTDEEISSNGTPVNNVNQKFHWDKEFQGTILACLYWGYTATQIPGGFLSFKYGGTFLLGIAVFGSSVLTLATPLVVRLNVHLFIVLRVIEGLLLGVVAPAGLTIISKWSPIYERSIFTTFGYSGLVLGTVIANSVSGLLAGSSWGWPSVFYFFGVLGVVWYILWVYFVYEEPSDHPNISEEELKIIGKHWHTKLSFRQIPWRYILTSLPVWCLIVVNFAGCWSFYTFMLSFPGYLKDVLQFDVTKIGFTSSIPYVICTIMAPVWGVFIDTLRHRKYLSTIAARKLSVALGMGISSIFMVAIAYANTSVVAMTVFVIAVSLTSLTASGPVPNLVELAPKYSGVLMGIVNFACNVTGFICPQVVGTITEYGEPAHQWTMVFYITGCMELFGMLVYLFFASSEKQPWADH